MGAATATGRGRGSSNKVTTLGLINLANGPRIMIAGTAPLEETIMSSPPSSMNTVSFPSPLPGSASDYVVLLTSISGGAVYVTHMNESGGNFVSFGMIGETECDVMYMVIKAGLQS